MYFFLLINDDKWKLKIINYKDLFFKFNNVN